MTGSDLAYFVFCWGPAIFFSALVCWFGYENWRIGREMDELDKEDRG